MKVSYTKGDGTHFGDTVVSVAGNPTLVVRKRGESYSGIRGSSGRRLGTFTYFDCYEVTATLYRNKLASNSTRKRSVAEALVKLAYQGGDLVRPDLVEAAYSVDADYAKHTEQRVAS